MGNYITNADLKLDDANLLRLTDDEQTGEVVTAVLDAAIVDAEGVVDSYASGRYSVPLTASAVVKKVARDLAVYFLYSRRSLVPENVSADRDATLAFLKDVSAGKANIPGAASAAGGVEDSTASGGVVGGSERTFGRGNLEGF